MSIQVRKEKLIGLAALVVWLHLLFGIYPLPPQAAAAFLASINEAPDPAVESAFWIQWVKTLLMLIAGVTSAFLAYRAIRFWKLAILVTSGLVAVPAAYYVLKDVVGHGGPGKWWSSWVTVVGRFLDKGEVWSITTKLYWLFAWPAYHLILVSVVAIVLIVHWKSSGEGREFEA